MGDARGERASSKRRPVRKWVIWSVTAWLLSSSSSPFSRASGERLALPLRQQRVSSRGVRRRSYCPGVRLTCISELSHGVTETIRPLQNKEQARAGKRDDVYLTGADCASTCEGVAGSGPNQVDCNQIIDGLSAQNTATFTMQPYSMASWAHASCTVEL